MQRVLSNIFLSGLTLLLVGCNSLPDQTPTGQLSEPVRLGEESSFIVLSETFARQLVAFDFEFGDFTTVPDFLDLSVGDTAKVEILRDGVPFFSVLELKLTDTVSEADIVDLLKDSRGVGELAPAAFGADSFYFLDNGVATNILPLGKSVFAFQLEPDTFAEVRDFISSLLILR